MTIRDLTKYRWKKDFHKRIWELMKEQNPKLPDYTWEQFESTGWCIKVPVAFSGRHQFELVNPRLNKNFKIPVMIEDHAMPHSLWLTQLIMGCPTPKQGGSTPAIREELYNYWYRVSPRMKDNNILNAAADYSFLTIAIGPSKTWVVDEIFKEIQSTPLDDTYVQPMATTSERYVKHIINMDREYTFSL